MYIILIYSINSLVNHFILQTGKLLVDVFLFLTKMLIKSIGQRVNLFIRVTEIVTLNLYWCHRAGLFRFVLML